MVSPPKFRRDIASGLSSLVVMVSVSKEVLIGSAPGRLIAECRSASYYSGSL